MFIYVFIVCCFTGSLTTRYIPEAKGLKIVNASKTDSGIFTCRALQVGKEDGFVESVDITFKVQRKLVWRTKRNNRYIIKYSLYNGFDILHSFIICVSPL